jgi:hypothetical protein
MRKRSSSEDEQDRQAHSTNMDQNQGSGLSAAAQPFVPTGESSSSRPVKAMPAKSKTLKGSNSYLPVQAKVPKTAEEKENTKRLIVILSKAGSPFNQNPATHADTLHLSGLSRSVSIVVRSSKVGWIG